MSSPNGLGGMLERDGDPLGCVQVRCWLVDQAEPEGLAPMNSSNCEGCCIHSHTDTDTYAPTRACLQHCLDPAALAQAALAPL